jgi:hypothetical protein
MWVARCGLVGELMTVFVDAESLCALLEREHPQHRLAASLWKIEVDSRSPMATSNYALLKACGAIHARHGVAAVRVLVEELSPLLHVEWVRQDDHRLGVATFLAAPDSRHDLIHHIDEVVLGRLRNAERFDV